MSLPLQERAYVTGLTAANLALKRLGVAALPAVILDVEEDEPHVAFAKQISRQISAATDGLGIKSPFL